jgi:iron complex transport system ATP-binding protein
MTQLHAISEPALAASDATIRIRGKTIVDSASLTLSPGELVAIVGPNGAGKTTLVRALAGVGRFQSGHVTWNGSPIGSLARRRLAELRAFLPQRPVIPTGMTVADTVLMGRAAHVGLMRVTGAADRQIADEAMAVCGIGELAQRQTASLSGGEQQRVFIALAIAQRAAAMLFDEPTTHLDIGAARRVGSILRDQADSGRAVLAVLHDLDLACALADRIIVMHDGRIEVDAPPAQAISAATLREIWGVDGHVEPLAAGRARIHLPAIIRAESAA